MGLTNSQKSSISFAPLKECAADGLPKMMNLLARALFNVIDLVR